MRGQASIHSAGSGAARTAELGTVSRTHTSNTIVPHFALSVATVVGTILGNYYFRHATIEEVFADAGAPGDAPEGSCVRKSAAWLKRTATDADVDGLAVLGRVLEDFMDTDIVRNLRTAEELHAEQSRVRELLGREGLEYLRGGRVVAHGATLPIRQLDDLLRDRDLGGVNREFERALDTVNADPAAAVTAACSIVEALCKVYIQDESLEMPRDQSILPLWRTVQADLGLDPKDVPDNDLKQVLVGFSSVMHGLGSFRTHVGSAHGRGRQSYRLAPRHARLVLNAAHTLAMFVIETWEARRQVARA